MSNQKDNKKEVVKRLSSRERREDLVKIIREVGLWRLPSQQRLAERYSVSQQQISKDMGKIFTTIPKRVLDEIFFEFFTADQKAQNELRRILNEGSVDEKLRAISVMIQLQNAFTNLLEKYGKKPIVPDRIKIEEGEKPVKITAKEWNESIAKHEKMFAKLNKEENKVIRDILFKDLQDSKRENLKKED